MYCVFYCSRLIKIVSLRQILSNSTIPHKVLTLQSGPTIKTLPMGEKVEVLEPHSLQVQTERKLEECLIKYR